MKLILGSRTYEPLSDVDAEVDGECESFGSTDAAMRAESLGARRRPLTVTRKELIESARMDGADVVLFVARDPVTKQPTEGMAGIQALLMSESIPFRVVSSPFPGSVSSAIAEYRHAQVARDKWSGDNPRRKRPAQKAATARAAVFALMQSYRSKLGAGFTFEPDNDELTDKWIRWLACYEALEDSLASDPTVVLADPGIETWYV